MNGVLVIGDHDSDGDGLIDTQDSCVASNQEETITIGDCDTEVANQLLEDGCTMSDQIKVCRSHFAV